MQGVRLLGIALVLGAATLGATSAEVQARCARLGFTVNDYGKDGPTKDAKSLLDKHIAKWTADRGIAKYTAGKKSVDCKLFLDFGFFDEHTCRAEAVVCWPDGPAAKPAAKPTSAGATPTTEPKPVVSKSPAPAKASAPAPVPAAKATAPAKREAEQSDSPVVAPIAPKQPDSGLPKAPPPKKVKAKAA